VKQDNKQKALMSKINALLLLNPDPQSKNGQRLAKLAAEYLQLLKNEFSSNKKKLKLLEVYMEGEPGKKPVIHFNMNTQILSDIEKLGKLFGELIVNIVKDLAGEEGQDKAGPLFFQMFNAMMAEIGKAKFKGVDFYALGEPPERKPKRRLDS